MPIFVVSIDSTPQNETEPKEAQVSETQIVLGRHFLCFECDDRRISRSHGLLVRGEDKVTIRSTHENPIYFKSGIRNDIETIIKESERELGNGDAFGLLREKFWYKIRVCNEPVNGSGVATLLRVRPPVELNLSQNLPQILSEVTNGRDQPESSNQAPQSDDCDINREPHPVNVSTSNEVEPQQPQNPLKRPITWTQACSQSIDSTTENDEPVPKRSRDNVDESQPQVPESSIVDNNSAAPGPSNSTNSTTTDTVDVKPVPEFNNVDSNSESQMNSEDVLTPQFEHGEATPAPQQETTHTTVAAGPSNSTTTDPVDVKPIIKKEAADSSALRDSCEFGIRCYRRTPDHRAQLAHPGDNDYRRPNYPPAPPNAPPCPFGASCYRRNPQHFIDFSHPDSSSYTRMHIPTVTKPI